MVFQNSDTMKNKGSSNANKIGKRKKKNCSTYQNEFTEFSLSDNVQLLTIYRNKIRYPELQP